ncbi:meckelin-like, partial [Salvelinus sp. IW2-2015]|uniref:meckelin-like n=1 Tax=Salvelinus sp. IW2-2015 TaxID=2691554 RepID=UPI0038D3C4C9
MATGMLLVCGLALFLTIKSNLLHSQQFTISFQRPSDCGVEQFYDISSQSCVKCGPNQCTSATGLSCECVTGFRVLATNGASITCQQCPLEKPAVTEDGYGCILCPGSLTEQGTCQCPSGSILVERDVQGNPLEEARCEVCNGAEPALSAPDSYGDRCQRCQSFTSINTFSPVCVVPHP